MNRKPVFDAVRKMLGRSFSESEVKALDAACDRAESDLLTSSHADARKPGKLGLELVKSFEGCHKNDGNGRFTAYSDPGSADGRPWTIGWGSTGPDVKQNTVWTQEECDARFEKDMQRHADAVARMLGDAPTTQNQFDALVSFHYNTGAIRTATLTKLHKQGKFEDARAQFARWINNDGRVMKGLVRRREAEAELYAKL